MYKSTNERKKERKTFPGCAYYYYDFYAVSGMSNVTRGAQNVLIFENINVLDKSIML